MKYFLEIIKKNKLLIWIYILLGITISFLENYSAKNFQKVIDDFGNGSLNSVTIAIYGGILILLYILSYIDEYPDCKLSQMIYFEFKLKALKKISFIDYKYYQSLGTGNLIQRIENGAEAGKSILFDFIFYLLRSIFPSIIFSLLFIAKISKTIMFCILGGYVLIFLITNILLKYLYRIKEKILVNEEMLNKFLVRGFMELVVFRINKRFETEIKKATGASNEIIHSKVKMKLIHEAFFASFAILIAIVKISTICYGWVTKSLSIGEVVALITLVDNAYTPIAIFNVLFVQYKLDKASFKRYTDFLDIPDDIMLSKGETTCNLQGDISFKNVKFSYENKKVIEDLSIEFFKGKPTAIVGESGSGKSTLIKLIIGFLKPKEGIITVDGKDLSKLNLNNYYNFVSYISQESPVFDGTLRENLVFDSKVEDSKIICALKEVQLIDFYNKLDKGLDSEIGERGVKLSGGERQRLALARLYFTNANIVILDEATSAMDNITEELVMRQVMNFLKEKTVIIIAHRMDSIKNVGRIIAFKEGEIIGEGNFDELLNYNEYFRNLYYANQKSSSIANCN